MELLPNGEGFTMTAHNNSNNDNNSVIKGYFHIDFCKKIIIINVV